MVSAHLTENIDGVDVNDGDGGSGDMKRYQVNRFLKELGVKAISPSDLINDYIIPSFKDGSWKVCFVTIYLLTYLLTLKNFLNFRTPVKKIYLVPFN